MEEDKNPRSTKVKVWLNKAEFTSVADDAAEAGFRRRGLPLYVQSPKNPSKMICNTDGISKFFKWVWQRHRENKVFLAEKAKEFALQEQKILEEKRKLGLIK